MDIDDDNNPIINHEHNGSHIVAVEPDYVYSAFITYVEIYNNNVYDLLDEDDNRSK